jgi:HAD superfamily hydrolase (TIGR01509 family)
MAQKAKYFGEAMKDGVMIFPGAEAFVKKAAEKYPVGLASGARRLEVEFILKKANLRGCFTAVVSADDVQHGKPDPESFLSTLTLLNERRLQGTEAIAPQTCLVIEDSKHGLAAAHKAGMKCMALTSSYKAEELTAADLVADSLVGLGLDKLENLFI